MDWFDLLAVQGALKSLLQHHKLKASILQHSAFFTVQLFVTPWTAAHQPSWSITNSQSLLKLLSIKSVMKISILFSGLPWSSCQCSRLGFNPWLGRSPGEENGNPLQYSCLGDSMDRGAWWATIHGMAKNQS